jgi:hypothetical protein
MKKSVLAVCIASIVMACNSEKEDLVQEVPKNGTIESNVTVTHLDANFDVLQTTYKVNKSGYQSQFITHTDTIPSLGTKLMEDENQNHQIIQEDYDIFITIK